MSHPRSWRNRDSLFPQEPPCTAPVTLNLGSYVSLCSLLAIIICFFLILILVLLTVYLLLYFLLLSQIFEDLTVDEWMEKRSTMTENMPSRKTRAKLGLWRIVTFATCAQHMLWSRYELESCTGAKLAGIIFISCDFQRQKISSFQYLAF